LRGCRWIEASTLAVITREAEAGDSRGCATDSTFKQPRCLQPRLRDLAAQSARGLLEKSRSLKSEGAGNAGRLMRPQPRVQNKKAHEHSHHGHTGFTRHSPRNGFNGYFVLSPVTGLFCHRHPRKLPSTNLTPASGRQDHTTSPSARSALVSSAARVHRIPSRVRDDREPPLQRDGTARIIQLILFRKNRNILQRGLDTPQFEGEWKTK